MVVDAHDSGFILWICLEDDFAWWVDRIRKIPMGLESMSGRLRRSQAALMTNTRPRGSFWQLRAGASAMNSWRDRGERNPANELVL